MERITLTYENADRLIADLRTLGRNLHPQRFSFLRGKAWHRQLLSALNEKAASDPAKNRLSLTFEVIYGHAFKAPPASGPKSEAVISLKDMKTMLGKEKSAP